MVRGTDYSAALYLNRIELINPVLIKQAGLRLQENAVFLNVVGGFQLTETAGDLAIAAAICSSFLEFPPPKGIAFIGEIGLAGELRTVPGLDKRVNAVAKLGYRMCVVPKEAEKVLGRDGFGKTKIVGCKNLKEVINTVFKEQECNEIGTWKSRLPFGRFLVSSF